MRCESDDLSSLRSNVRVKGSVKEVVVSDHREKSKSCVMYVESGVAKV